MMVTRIYRVPEVSCQHCVQAISEELRAIPGIREVEVDLVTKTVRVVAEDDVPDTRIREGIEAAGYAIAEA
ncbi:MAG: heavy metal-associated domain-containing protein [Thermomicrobium sp.]|nr:heavy metal-associated domain-containing protein [Thermomicrobium sp.]